APTRPLERAARIVEVHATRKAQVDVFMKYADGADAVVHHALGRAVEQDDLPFHRIDVLVTWRDLGDDDLAQPQRQRDDRAIVTAEEFAQLARRHQVVRYRRRVTVKTRRFVVAAAALAATMVAAPRAQTTAQQQLERGKAAWDQRLSQTAIAAL